MAFTDFLREQGLACIPGVAVGAGEIHLAHALLVEVGTAQEMRAIPIVDNQAARHST